MGHHQFSPRRPERSRSGGGHTSMDAHVLRRKISRTCDEGARALLGSLLTYVTDRAGGPPGAADPGHAGGCSPPSQEAGRRPTRFQLLQAKFMGTGREHHLKRTREVGRLISRDKQGPSRSLVSATINKLLEKTQASPGGALLSPRRLAGEKPRWGPPGGKGTVKSILRKFLAAEEKEKKEKEAGAEPPGRQPGAARGLLPRTGGRSTILCQLRERFEQSSCLRSEASLLPLHREGRRSLQKKTHRPELRVLHTTTMAISCTRTPPARFLACTAEPLPALSIATVVCSPQSWLSHCAKVSHLESRRWPRRDISMSSDPEDTDPSRDKMPGIGILSKEPRGQPKPSKSSMTQVAAPRDSHLALNPTEGIPQQDSAWASREALPDHMPLSPPFRPARPRGAGPAEGDKTVGLTAEGLAGHPWGLKEEGAGEVPDVIMTVCSSEDEAESSLPASDREPLFATQRHLPEQGPAAQIPPLAAPRVQAARRAQPALKSPPITVRLPVVHEMPAPPGPLQSTWPGGDRRPRASGGHIAGPPATEDREAGLASGGLSPSCRTSKQGSPESPRVTAPVGPGDQQPLLTVLTANSPQGTPAGKGSTHSPVSASEGRNPRTASGQGAPELSCQQPPPPNHPGSSPCAWKSPPGHSTCSTSGSQQGPGSREGGAVAAPAQDFRGPESPTRSDRRVLCGQEDSKGPEAEAAPPLGIAQEDAHYDWGKKSLALLDEPPKPSGRACRATAPGGKVPSPTGDRRAPPGDAWVPEDRRAPTGSSRDPEDRKTPTGSSRDPEDRKIPKWSSRDPKDRKTPPGSSRDPKDRKTPTGSSRDLEDRKIPKWSSRDPEDRKTPKWSSRDPEDRKTPPGSSRDPEDRRAPTESSRDPEDRRAPTGSSRDPEDRKAPPPPGSAQDPEKRTALLGGVGDPEDGPGAEWKGAEEHRVQSAHHCAATGNRLLGETWPPEPGGHRFLTPGESSKHKSRTAEGGVWEERAGQRPPTGVPVPAGPEEALGACPAPAEALLGASQDNAAVGTGSRAGRATGGGPQPRDAACRPTPCGSPAGSLAQQARDGGGRPPAAHTLAGVASAPSCLTRPAPEPEAKPAHERAPGQAESLGPTQGRVGKPEEGVTGHERPHQTQEPDGSGNRGAAPGGEKAGLCAAESRAQAAQDQAGGQRAAAMEKPCQPRARGQEHPLGPSVRQVRNLAQEGGPKADRSPATPSGTPGGSCSLTTQGRVSGMVSQAWGQPDGSADRARAAGACGEPQRPTHRVSGQGSPRAPRPTPGSRPLAGRSSSAQPPPDAGGCPAPQLPAQTGLPNTPGAERDLSEGEPHRRSGHLAKYKAQSFSNQTAFDLSFRPTLLRASDTFEAPQ
ncbi:collagen alpha-1(I) chain [Marmota marmota marmota]|uniref:collagen alpha-1(I) chain n=1 Tax=Marmota marmota marmota TaxID=9994 RepID=UPI0020938D8C|nr:collagen alpha-1(I) chain [Marmota marmota marmota]